MNAMDAMMVAALVGGVWLAVAWVAIGWLLKDVFTWKGK